MKTNHILWLSALLWVVAACGGDDTDPDPEPDPCAEAVPVTADFDIEQVFRDSGPFRLLYDTIDTVTSGQIRFSAVERPGYSYEWHIGAGVYQERQVQLGFPRELNGQSIPITLIVSGPIDTLCFPQDDGRDTLTRQMHVISSCESLVSGRYTGHWLSTPPTDTFTVRIQMVIPSNDPDATTCYQVTTENLTRRGIFCDKYGGVDNKTGYRMLVFNGSDSQCFSPDGEAEVWGDSIRIRYSFIDENFERQPAQTFVGRRR